METTAYQSFKQNANVRLKLTNVKLATITISEVAGQQVQAKTTKVLIRSIQPDELAFDSILRFPIADGYRIAVSFKLQDRQVCVVGIICGREQRHNMYRYKLEFTHTSIPKNEVIKRLNERLLAEPIETSRIHTYYRRVMRTGIGSINSIYT
ncbi:hypothetical protein PaecuDRAFT_1541 [Paenibacillus curdlanolyticus YK9]|uniref:Uncharacterized protein n=2 Tax=Paenibacillus curdlanolyticus TaxID=59840 RepID=E0I7B7_9BACL|nr:hypothetical protein PaecuDRAFT_1541 [Paenibacillus curdlanolyticus YK9]